MDRGDFKLTIGSDVANSAPTPVTLTDIANKQYVDDNAGGGSSIDRTGQTITFDVSARYNKTTPADNSAITIDATGAVIDSVARYYINAASEPTISGSTQIKKTGKFVANELNIFWFTWDGNGYILNIQ